MADAGQQRGVVDLVAVEVKDRQNRAVANRVQELADVPGCRQRPGFRFAVADYGRNDQVGIIERGAAGVREHVAQFTAFVDRAGRFGSAVTADAAGKRELLEELAQPSLVFALVRVDLGVGALEIDRRQNSRRTVPGSGQEDHVQVEFLDQAVQVNIGERQAGARSPVSEQPVLDVLGLEGFFQQRIVLQIDHAERQVVAGSPIGVSPL